MTPIVPDTLEFDLMLGAVPSAPYPLLPTIAQRARALLAARTPVQVESAFYTLDWLLETAYHQRVPQAPEPELEQAQDAQPPATAGVAGQESATNVQATPMSPLQRRFIAPQVGPLDVDFSFPPTSPFSKLDTLIDYYDIWEELIADDLPQPQPAEVYAVLALTLVREALIWLHRLRLSRTHPPTPLSLSIATAMALSGSAAIEAMGAVCRAEFFHVSAFMTEFHVEALDKTRGRYTTLMIERREAEQAKHDEIVQKRTTARHKNARKAEELAIALWEQAPWPSIDKAALDIRDRLAEKGYRYVPRTIGRWISRYVNSTGKKMR